MIDEYQNCSWYITPRYFQENFISFQTLTFCTWKLSCHCNLITIAYLLFKSSQIVLSKNLNFSSKRFLIFCTEYISSSAIQYFFFNHSYQFVVVNRDKASEDFGHWPQSLGPPIPLWHIWLGSPCIKWRWQQTPYTRVMWLCVLNRKVVFNSVCQVEAYSSTKRLCPKLAQELGRYKLVLQQNYT